MAWTIIFLPEIAVEVKVSLFESQQRVMSLIQVGTNSKQEQQVSDSERPAETAAKP